ncbi:shikimate dehydrogenase [Microbacterium sp. T2.11-28]|uniref:shikimate dehydrogenase family protein n=1 Tax=Microbacterium sp. T2.11-28 TaxID=3041169 RepID=UPI002477CBB4|nr:shikimate dehydrogenase [Microbacterium sp. T2.11-28]CAI9385945.1 Shikimate dehydrogenase (NADP(+)) [Microbacterium sp. T2.11-28]
MPALEVWGDPIDHSLSPALHTAAYAELGWEDWTYGRRRVAEADFARELSSLGPDVRGLSCTMPLKTAVHAVADERDTRTELTGAGNTLLLTEGRRRAFNTDVGGIIRALEEAGIERPASARIVGAGATATSALVALAEWGVGLVDVVARRPNAIAGLRALGDRLGVAVDAAPLTARFHRPHPLTLATLPGDAPVGSDVAESLAAAGGVLFDVVYGHWPTVLASAWQDAGLRAVSGEGMLLHQAVLQIRIFATADVTEPLPDEQAVVAVMRRALVGG